MGLRHIGLRFGGGGRAHDGPAARVGTPPIRTVAAVDGTAETQGCHLLHLAGLRRRAEGGCVWGGLGRPGGAGVPARDPQFRPRNSPLSTQNSELVLFPLMSRLKSSQLPVWVSVQSSWRVRLAIDPPPEAVPSSAPVNDDVSHRSGGVTGAG